MAVGLDFRDIPDRVVRRRVTIGDAVHVVHAGTDLLPRSMRVAVGIERQWMLAADGQ